MPIKDKAPVAANGTVEVKAPPHEVWRLISNIDNWPSWNPDVKSAHLTGELRPGSTFIWKAGPGTIRSELTLVKDDSLVAWRGTMLGIRAHHTWRLEPTDLGTAVSTEETWTGLLPRTFPRSMTKSLQTAINRGLQAIKGAVESQHVNT